MAIAVCVRCGLVKNRIYRPCERCGFDPTADDLNRAKSIRLSSDFLDDNMEPPSRSDLLAISESIESGLPFVFDDQETAELLDQKSQLSKGLLKTDVVRIVGFILILFLPGLAWILLKVLSE